MAQLPEQLLEIVSEHIYHPRLSEHYDEIYDNLSDEQTTKLNDLLWKVYRREIRISEFERQAAALNLPKFQEEIWPGILRYDLMPVADYLGFRIQDYLNHLRAADFKNFRAIDLADWIAKLNVEKRLGLNTVDQKKVFNILSQYLRGLKSGDEIAELISRPANLGGIGLNPDIAKEIVQKFKDDLQDALANDRFITEQPLDLQLIEKLKAKKEEDVFFKEHQVKIKESGIRNQELGATSKEQASVESVSRLGKGSGSLDAPVMAVKTAEPFQPAIETYESEAGKIIRQVDLKLAPELEKKVKIVIVSRLKDIRKQSELREKLLGAPIENGIGLKVEEAEKIIKLAEDGRNNLMKAVPAAPAVIPTANVGATPSIAPVVPPKPAKTPPRGDLGGPATIPAKRDLGGVQPPRPATMQMEDNFAPRTSSDIKRSIPQAIKIVPQLDNRPKVELAPPLPPKPPPTMAIPQTSGGKAKLEDVAYRPRLMGPMEELKEMSLLDFRRLSPKVKVSIDKISAKIELLGQESYQNKIRGIQAWQGSPVNSLYKAILNESLRKSLTVNQVIEEKQKRSEETLKPEEFKAVVELNRSFKV